MTRFPVLKMLKLQDHNKFKASLDYIGKLSVKNKETNKKIPLFHINLTKSVNNFSLCSAGILMFKSSNYIQGSYLIIKFFIEKYVKFGAEVLLSIFLIIFLFLYHFIDISCIGKTKL